MGVRRFKDVSEMEQEVWFSRDDPRRFAAMRSAWDFARQTLRPRFPPGVHRCRSAEEAAEQRERWERQNLETFQRRRRSPGSF
jgi:hypothetical protein